MTERDLATEGSYFLIDSPITLTSGEVSIGTGSVLCFRGGKLVNGAGCDIILKGDNVTIEAGPVEIFQKDEDNNYGFNIKASDGVSDPQWTMERAYPQWFGAKDCSSAVGEALAMLSGGNISGGKLKLELIPDSSEAINAAIKLKSRGEVVIPKGYYKLSRSINVRPGIRLRGEGSIDRRDMVSGTILFPWRSPGHSGKDYSSYQYDENASDQNNKSLLDFPLPPNDVDWLNKYQNYDFRFGYMMTACIKDKCRVKYKKVGGTGNNSTYSSYPSSIEYIPDTGNRLVGTEISSLSMVDLMSLGVKGIPNQYGQATMRAILIGGAVTIRDVRVYGLSQFVSSTNSEYEDLHRIEHCIFSGPVTLNDGNIMYNRLYPEKIYAYELSGYGDGLVFQGNHKSQYSSRIGALHLKSCNGGSVTGNILNGDVLIENSQGIDFAGNHMEYGSRLTIASSGVVVRGNFIWRGEKAAITIRRFDSGGYLYYHSSVTLDNNQLFWRMQHYAIQHDDENNNPDSDPDSDPEPVPDPPQAAHFLFPYDVVTDGYASITINNTFRQCFRNIYGESSYFGILMGWLEMKGLQSDSNKLDEEQAYTYAGEDPRDIIGTDYARISAFEEFNRISHLASIGSKVVGRQVTPMPSTIDKLSFDFHRVSSGEVGMRIGSRNVTYEDKDGWKIPDDVAYRAYQDYRAWLFADYQRRILMKGPVNLLSYYDDEGKEQCRITDAKQNLWIAIGQGNITNWNVPSGPYWLYIERQSYTEQSDQNSGPQQGGLRSTLSMHRAVLPMSNATILWDDGLILSGYNWETMESAGNFSNPEVNNNVERVQYHGKNVECLFSAAPSIAGGQPQLVGLWLDGDVIKWVSNGVMVTYCKSNGSWRKYQ